MLAMVFTISQQLWPQVHDDSWDAQNSVSGFIFYTKGWIIDNIFSSNEFAKTRFFLHFDCSYSRVSQSPFEMSSLVQAVDEVHKTMDLKNNIRNLTVIGHASHGKSTLTDCLVAAAGIIPHEAERGMTIKSTPMSLCYEMSEDSLKRYEGLRDGNKYLLNLIDSPGHVDLSSEVTAALRISDCALVVVDCIEGVCIQTNAVLRQAMEERIRPVLIVNKLDKCFLELEIDGECAYHSFQRAIENTNATMSPYEFPHLPDIQVYPEKGTVAFSSGLHGWAFTLGTFARMYASKFDVDEEKMTERLWGDNFFDTATRKWTTKSTGSSTCKRGFVQFCYEPIKQIIDNCMIDQHDTLWRMLEKLGIHMNSAERDLMGLPLMKLVMDKWLPASTSLLETIIFHLPSPKTAQPNRVAILYNGFLNDPYSTAIRRCDPMGPLMIYVSKMIQATNRGGFFAFGRVFSGKVSTGQSVRIMGPDYVPGQGRDMYVKSVQRTVIWMGNNQHVTVGDVSCGNMVCLFGLDQFITKTATITSADEVNAEPFHPMQFCVSPVVRVAVQCKNPSDIPKLIKGLKLLEKSDPLIKSTTEESGEHVVAGAGELHINLCLKDLEDNFMGGAHITRSNPVVSFRETVLDSSDHIITSMSPNKKNCLCMVARPMEDGLAEALESGRIVEGLDVLATDFGWEKGLAKKIWCFSPENIGPNMLVDKCKGVSYLDEIKGFVMAGFQAATSEGPLANERVRGLRFELTNAALPHDGVQRCNTQLINTAQRAVYASMLSAKPRLLEPIYRVEIKAPSESLKQVENVLRKRRGSVFDMDKTTDTNQYTVFGSLPVKESFGFADELRAATSAKAFAQFELDRWVTVESDPLEEGSVAAAIVSDIRRRKGLDEKIKPLSEFEDAM